MEDAPAGDMAPSLGCVWERESIVDIVEGPGLLLRAILIMRLASDILSDRVLITG